MDQYLKPAETVIQKMSKHKIFYFSLLLIILVLQMLWATGDNVELLLETLIGGASVGWISYFLRVSILGGLIFSSMSSKIKRRIGTIVILLFEFQLIFLHALAFPVGILFIGSQVFFYYLLIYVAERRGTRASKAAFILLVVLSILLVLNMVGRYQWSANISDKRSTFIERVNKGEIQTFEEVKKECQKLGKYMSSACRSPSVPIQDMAISIGDPRICELKYSDAYGHPSLSRCVMQVLKTREEKIDYCNAKTNPKYKEACFMLVE